jgi:hypothetical protein
MSLYFLEKRSFASRPRSHFLCKCGYRYIHKHQAKHNRSYLHQKALGLIKSVISNNNNCVINVNITVNNLDELEQLEQDFLNAMK